MKLKSGVVIELDIPDSVRARGRRSICTPELVAKVVELVRAGATDAVAAGAAGIARATFYNWLRRGEAGEEPYASARTAILEASDEARASAEIALKEIDPKAFVRYASRNDPVNRWEPDAPAAVQVNVNVNHSAARRVLSTEELLQLESMQLKLASASQVVEGEVIEPS